ncbi:DUF6171 family protein [Bacillus suaedae]|uniref:Uncharacterized protein n=1 Tax=Halalkalibacter suaedae TaxID=2822140 RepID=A0A940X1V1_9BACI|nr:DUF6171 family protein [Bacillus suaedae]MBP3953559.1 hypothetical protein [Bacillus suaedae]
MIPARQCKSCGTNVKLDKDQVAFNQVQSVADWLYEKRVSICKACPSLLYGTTCQHAGDIVTYRALSKEKGCPYPGHAKW